MILTESKNGEEYIRLTSKGIKRAKKYIIDDIYIERLDPWDGKWRMVVFDIPENLKSVRNIFRNKLLNLGFIIIQDSVFIIPWECEDIVRYLAREYKIVPFVVYVLADKIDVNTKTRTRLNRFFNHLPNDAIARDGR